MANALRIAGYDDPTFDPLATMDLMQGFEEIADPYPRFHKMHAEGTVHQGDMRAAFGLEAFSFWGEYPSWMVFGYDAVSRVFSDGANFSNAVKQHFYDNSFGASINGMDGPEHSAYRRLLQKAFMPQSVARWGKDLVPQAINALIDRFVDRGRAELISEFTEQYPFHVIYGQLDLPDEDRETFQSLSAGLNTAGATPLRSNEASRKLGDYFTARLDEKRAQLARGIAPGSDLIAMLAQAEVNGERLPDEVAISFLRQLMAAAGDTTFRNTGSLLVGLLKNPEQLDAVRKDRSLVAKAVEEGLRWEAPLTFEQRTAVNNVVVGGVAIAAGSKVDVVIGSANRDPARFEKPDEFDIFRKSERNLTFAYGPHVCIGQHLARLELTHALNALLDRLPNLRLDPDQPPPRILGLNSRSPQALHVIFD